MKHQNKIVKISAFLLYAAFIFLSSIFGFNPGKQIGHNFIIFFLEMLKLLPCIFILIGLFEVWVKKEVITKHLGKGSGILSYVWAILLAGPIAGGLLPAFPIAYSLFQKGARLNVIFTFIGAAAVCRIPMTLFEASFMGIKFSLIRLIVSIPLVILSSIWLGNYLEKRNYRIMGGK
ncbi:MAG: permease [Elusimicrobiota bacterium]|nr:permease [Elusimicrobiota bacterium]